MAEYASNGKGNLGVVLGSIGAGLGAVNSGMGGGILGNLFGGGCNNGAPVNRYEMELNMGNAAKDSEIALLKSNIYQDQKAQELYRYVDGKFEAINAALAALGVQNARTEDGFAMVRQDLGAVEQRMNAKIKLEAERRCCTGNAIVNYVNATFYPKQVADVTVGTTSTAQTLYNPIPDCGDGGYNG